VADVRAEAENVLLLDAGDALVGGGALGDLTEGRAVVQGMDLMGYDAMAIGPKELGLGAEELASRIAEAGFPLLSANVTSARDGAPVAEPYTLIDLGGHTIGVIGLTRPEPDVPSEFVVEDPLVALERVLPDVAARAGTIVVLSNLDLRTASDYAENVSGTDLWVVGLPDIQPNGYQETAEGGTYIVSAEHPQAQHTGRRVGRLALTVAPDGSVTPLAWQTLAMDKALADDPAMSELLDQHWTEFWGPDAAPIE